MKRTTFTHHKLVDLAGALNIGEPEAAGTLGFLWYAAAEYAQAGDIGRFTDEKIAWLCRWKGDPRALIDALVSTGWVDRVDGLSRLIIHDWPDHCEESTHSKLARKRAFFANGCAPSVRGLSKEERADAAKWYASNPPPKTTKPRQRRPKAEKHHKETPQPTPQEAPHPAGNVSVVPLALPSHASPSHALASPLPRLVGGNADEEDDVLAMLERFAGSPPGLSADLRRRVIEAERVASEGPPIRIDGLEVPRLEVWRRAVSLRCRHGPPLKTGSMLVRWLEGCLEVAGSTGKWPGEDAHDNGVPTSRTVDELLAIDTARRARA